MHSKASVFFFCGTLNIRFYLYLIFLMVVGKPGIQLIKGSNVHNPTSYTVAVYEHKPTGSPADSPVQLMLKNMRAYKAAASEAAAHGTKLIIFPEYGLYSTASYSSRDQLQQYLQTIPKSFTPCEFNDDLSGSEIITDLSCTAKSSRIQIVANVGTIHWCNNTGSNAICPPDGRFQYNTNIVFSDNGTIQAVYHKYNLFGERFFDKPPLEYVTFTTTWGVIGVGTCFDLLQKDPLLHLVEEKRVDAVVLPSLWFNRIPFLGLYEIAEGWAVRNGISLLAANLHSPVTAHVGSGIFGPNGVINYTYVTDVSSGGQLVIATLPAGLHRRPEPGIVTNLNLNAKAEKRNIFHTLTNGDLFQYTPLHLGRKQTISVCDADFCCFLNYTYSDDMITGGFFALGVFNGLHTENYTLYNEVCSVVRCIDEQHCGDGISSAAAGLSDLYLTGTFSSATYAYPTVLVDNALLADAGQWRYDHASQTLHSAALKRKLDKILVFGLYGRNYAKDFLN